MLADRVRMGKVKNSKIEVTIHISNFQYLDIYVVDGTLDAVGNPDYASADTLVHTSNGNEIITLKVEKGSYITVSYNSIYNIDFSFYYTSLDSDITSLGSEPSGGNIHITESIHIYYDSIDDD